MTQQGRLDNENGRQDACLLPTVDIVVPLYNEADQIRALLQRLGALSADPSADWRFIFVDDGSTDETAMLLLDGSRALGRGKLVRLTRNFGLQSACRAGLDHANGDAVVFLDADLQDPPELVPEMVRRWREGASVVVGVRTSRPEKGARGFLLKIFHVLFAWLTDRVMPPDSGNFGLMDKRVAERLRSIREANVFFPALRVWASDSVALLPYERGGRTGKPRQTFSRLLAYAWDGVTSFSEKPLRFISILGVFIAVPSFLYGMLLVMQRFLQFFGLFKGLEVLGFTTVAVAVFFMGGVQLICLGVIGEYVARIYRESKGRPAYFVSTVSDLSPTSADIDKSARNQP